MSKKIPVMVTTEYGGVFMGYIEEDTHNNDPLLVDELQMCNYWDSETRGVIGLAANGPSNGCRITAPAGSSWLKKITAVVRLTSKAERKWRSIPWSK